MKKAFSLMLCALVLLSIALCCHAEDERVDLNERFGDVPSVQYGQTEYVRRNRQNAVLLMSTENGSLDRLYVLNADDNEKTVYLLRFDCDAQYLPDQAQVSWNQIFASAEDSEAAARQLQDVLNTLLPLSPVDSYMVLDMSMMDELVGMAPDMPSMDGMTFEEKVSLFKDLIGDKPSSDLNQMFSTLSGYITTDMKSGAVMKLLNKLKKYDIQPITDFIGETQTLIDIFLTEKKVW